MSLRGSLFMAQQTAHADFARPECVWPRWTDGPVRRRHSTFALLPLRIGESRHVKPVRRTTPVGTVHLNPERSDRRQELPLAA